MHWIEDVLFSSPVPGVTGNKLSLEGEANFVDAGYDGDLPMAYFTGTE